MMSRTTPSAVGRLAALLVGAAALMACSSDATTIDSAKLEDELRVQLSEDAGVDPEGVSVSCPDDIEAEEGDEFNCELTAPNGDIVQVDVTLTNDDGGFEAVVPPQSFD